MWQWSSGRGWRNSTSSWKPRPYEEGDESEIARLAAKVYPSIDINKFLETWRSKYAGSPGGFVSWIADGDGEVVGHYGSLITSATLAGKSVVVAQAVDAFTHPGWRRRGIFVGLGKILLEDLGKKGVHLTYGIPNRAAMPGHEKLSWAIVAKIPRLIAILDREQAISAYQGGWLKRLALRISSALHQRARTGDEALKVSVSRPPLILPDIGTLWATAKEEFGFAIERSKEYLSWRYSVQSSKNYTMVTKAGNEGPVAVAICGIGVNGMGQLAELFYRRGHEKDAEIVLRGAILHLKKNGCNTVEALASTREIERVLKSTGFFRVSRVLFIAHANDAEGANQLRTLRMTERIMLSFGDSDLA